MLVTSEVCGAVTVGVESQKQCSLGFKIDFRTCAIEISGRRRDMVHAIQNVHEALKLVLHVAMLVLMPSQILNLYLR